MIICNSCGSILDEAHRFCMGCGAPALGARHSRSFTPTTAVEVFVSYSHKDERLKNQLIDLLKNLKAQGVVTTWTDREITAGKPWAREIDEHLNSANVILLLVSLSFMASDYCRGVEVKRAMERYSAGEALVIPVILEDVDWEGAPFSDLLALPTDAKPVSNWTPRSKGFANIAKGLRAALKDFAGPTADGPVIGNALAESLKLRRIDAAVPSEASLEEHLDLLVQVRFQNSPLLGAEDWPPARRPPIVTQISSETILKFPVDRRTGSIGPARLEIQVIAPDFEIGSARQKFIEVPPDKESEMVRFLLTARHIGTCKINVEVYSSDQTYLGAIPLETRIADTAVSRSLSVANLALVVSVEPKDRGFVSDEYHITEIPRRAHAPSFDSAPQFAPSTQDGPTVAAVGSDDEIILRVHATISEVTRIRRWIINHGKLVLSVILISLMVTLAFAYWRSMLQPSRVTPEITITQVPPYDPVGGPATSAIIAGEVSGVDPRNSRVVIYAFTNMWYVQPLEADPFTPIESDGKWNREIHVGTRYAALVVKSTFRPPTKVTSLPEVGGEVLAVQVVPGRR